MQNYNSHHAWTGWDDGSCNLATAAEPHRLCKTAVPIQECCTACGPPAADPPITVSAADPPITVRHPLTFSATVPRNYEGHSADSSVITVFCCRKIRSSTVVSCQIYRNCGKMSKQKRISALKDVIKYFTTFFASKFFSQFSSSKT